VFFLLDSGNRFYLFSLEPSVFIMQGVLFLNVAILAFILTKLLYKPVKDFLARRAAMIHDEIQTAENEKAKAIELRSQYERKVKEIEEEKIAIMDEARKLAAENRDIQMAAARSEAESVKARAQKEIQIEQDRAKDEMKQAVINISSAMAAKFLSRNIDEETHDRLFDETMAELEGIAWRN